MSSDAAWFLGGFWTATPFGEYRNFFNVKLVHVISNDNGADGGVYGPDRDTALGAYFYCSNIERLLCVNTGTVFSVAAADTPEWDAIFVMVNDTKYGGAGYGSGIAVFSVN